MIHARTRRGGFTLIELLLVLAILGVIMAMVVPNLMDRQKYANIDATRGSIAGAEQAVKMYSIDHLGSYPTSQQGFEVLIERPTQGKRWRGPYLDSLPTDAWGNPLKYEFPGRKNPAKFDVSSAGPDGQHGTEDDIGNWEEP
jgi:general secretion pathway protein G